MKQQSRDGQAEQGSTSPRAYLLCYIVLVPLNDHIWDSNQKQDMPENKSAEDGFGAMAVDYQYFQHDR